MTKGVNPVELKPYNRQNFPIAGVLEDMTEVIHDQGMDYVEAYALTNQKLGQAELAGREFDYIRTAVTSGGHSRVSEVAGLGIGAVIKANTDTSREMLRNLEAKGDIKAKNAILPTDLGKTGWDQTQFMGYFALTIGRPDLAEIAKQSSGFTKLEKKIGRAITGHEIDLELMGNPQLTHDQRRPEYAKFAQAFASLFRGNSFNVAPVERIIGFVDTDLSLGSYSEKMLGQHLGIPQFRVAIAKPGQVDDLSQYKLREDLRVISANGGEVCVAPSQSTLTLVRDS